MNNASDELVTHSSSGKMSPDPKQNEINGPVSGSDVPSFNFLQLEDSDSDASPEDDGYELLNANELDNYDDEDMNTGNHVNLTQPNGYIPASIMSRLNDESDDEMEPSNSLGNKDSCPLTQDQTEVIKSVMKGIKLPESAVPSWAAVIPEERWKSLLDSKIEGNLDSPPSEDN